MAATFQGRGVEKASKNLKFKPKAMSRKKSLEIVQNPQTNAGL
ncbi:MAG: hypothetical protein ABR878_10680 [Roseiarcus sp.]|jgi:hypothetical protein